jgi:major outer membrane protein
MRKALAIALICWMPLKLSALPTGNPAEASLLIDGIFLPGSLNPCVPCRSWYDFLSLRVGFYGDYIFDRHLVTRSPESRNIADTEIYTNASFFALNFYDCIDFFAILGVSEFHFDARQSLLGITATNIPLRIESDTHFSWSLGSRLTFWEKGCFALGAEVQYFNTQPDLNFLHLESLPPIYLDGYKLNYQEWQAGLGIAYRVNIHWHSTALVPYAAIKWSRVRFDMEPQALGSLFEEAAASLFRGKNGRNWGYALGLSLIGCNKTSVTVEGRLLDEQAIFVNTQFRF